MVAAVVMVLVVVPPTPVTELHVIDARNGLIFRRGRWELDGIGR